MALTIIILIVFAIILYKKKKLEKWYEELSETDKTKVKELEIKLTEINSRVKNIMPKEYKLYEQLFDLSKNLVKNEEIVFFTNATIIIPTIIGKNTVNQSLETHIYVTNKKILIINKDNTKIIPLENISSIDSGTNGISKNFSWIKINDHSTTIELAAILKEDAIKLKEEINKGIENHKKVSIDITQTTEKDISDKIARLQVLYEEGVLTEYEFNIKKMELLDKIK